MFRITLLTFLLLFFASCNQDEVKLSVDAGFKKIETNSMEFYWKIEDGILIGKMVAETDGWLGVGFNPIDRMYGAVMVLGYIKGDEPGVVEEHYGDTVQTHKPVLELGRKRELLKGEISHQGSNMVMSFAIPLSTIEQNKKGDKTKLLLAYGKTHRLSSYHALNRTMVEISLL